MKDKPSEWIVIADLMSGVVAVVMLMLVVSVVQKQAADQRHQAAMSEGEDAKRQKVSEVLTQMKTAFASQGASGYVAIDTAAGKVTLLENVFKSGSACIDPKAQAAFSQVESAIRSYLLKVDGGQIFVEGHTDNQKVRGSVTNARDFCAVYDDNFTLSAARAREARRLIIGQDDNAAKRVIVAGYGDSHPLDGLDPADERNRRVELRFVSVGGR